MKCMATDVVEAVNVVCIPLHCTAVHCTVLYFTVSNLMAYAFSIHGT